MNDAMRREIIQAAVALCRKHYEYQDDGLDVPAEIHALEAALERAEATSTASRSRSLPTSSRSR